MDVRTNDVLGKQYNVELQKADSGAKPKRARYNSSLMDGNAILPGDDIELLPETYVIFITELFENLNNSVYPKKMIIRAGMPETAQVKGSCSFLF